MAGHRLIAAGTQVVAAAITPEPLVANPTPCALVWVGATHNDAGVAQNTSVARVGLQGTERMQLMPADAGGFYIPICDANQLYVDVGTNGDSVEYTIFA